MEKNEQFVHLPSTAGGVLVRRDQIVGARPNGPNEGSILYTEAGPAIYTSLHVGDLAKLVSAERVEQN